MRETGNSIVAWIALIVAIIALSLAWVAYNRTGEDLENRIQQQVQEAAQNTQDAAQEGAQNVQEGAQEGAQNIDEGPDGVDEDDTETQTQGGGTSPDTNTNTTQ